MLWMRATAWATPLVGVVLMIVVYRDVYAAEDGRYAGAEPALAGVFVATPFLFLVLMQVCCAAAAQLAATARNCAVCVSAALLLTLVGLVGALLVVT